MENDDAKKVDATVVGDSNLSDDSKPLMIFTSEEDKTGTDITAMSNFFDVYIDELTRQLSVSTVADTVDSIPVGDVSIVTDLLHHAKMVSRGDFEFVLDFDSLPLDIKDGLSDGTYHIGESRQVEGNARAVIMDQDNVRVKDVTAKEVQHDIGTIDTVRSIANQMQLRQIYAKLQDLQELQEYQIDRDRDRDIVTPFLNARNYIVKAQIASSKDEQAGYIHEAVKELTTATNSIYTDLATTSKHLSSLTRLPIFQPTWIIRRYVKYLTADLQLATKYVGVHMHALDYLGDRKGAQFVLEEYQHVLKDFFSKAINTRDQSAAELVHLYYPYDESNRNYWLQLKKEMQPVLEAKYEDIESKKIMVVSVEEVKDNERGE